MSKWRNIVNGLDLEYDEEFAIDTDHNHTYKFTHYGLLRKLNGVAGWVDAGVRTLTEIVNGDREITPVNWAPKRGKLYYTYLFEDDKSSEFTVVSMFWTASIGDYMRYKLGLVFKSKSAANAALDRKNFDFFKDIPSEIVLQREEQ